MPDEKWIAQFKALLKERGLSVRGVVFSTPGLRPAHYVQVHRYLHGMGGLSRAKRDALTATAWKTPVRPSVP